MSVDDLHELPKVRDSWSYLYVERCRVDQHDKAIAVHDVGGSVAVPCASLTLLMLGPGTNVTHAAIRTLAENGCMVAWTGEQAVRLYATGLGETRSARNLLRQAWLCSDPARRLRVVRRMYQARFSESLAADLTLQQIRGLEGVRVRETYAAASRATGVPWQGRAYRRGDWRRADPVNRALSAANSCLYGVCHAAVVSAGYSPALGFIHTGKMLSFVYDVADLYKTETTIPAAFLAAAAADEGDDLEGLVRRRLRDRFAEAGLLARVVDDLRNILGGEEDSEERTVLDSEQAAPGGLWDPERGAVRGGQNYADDDGEGGAPRS